MLTFEIGSKNPYANAVISEWNDENIKIYGVKAIAFGEAELQPEIMIVFETDSEASYLTFGYQYLSAGGTDVTLMKVTMLPGLELYSYHLAFYDEDKILFIGDGAQGA